MKSGWLRRFGRLFVALAIALPTFVVLAPDGSGLACMCPPTLDLRGRIVFAAQGEVGFVEGPADNQNPYGPDVAWCAIFARWTWNQAGTTSVFSTNVAESVYTWGKNHQRWKISAPRPGDVIVWSAGTLNDSTGGHVGVVEYVADGYIHSIDGNFNDGVRRRSFPNRVGYVYGSQTLRGFVAPPGAPMT